MFASFFVVVFLKPPHEFFEDGGHTVVVQAGVFYRSVVIQDRVRTEIDFRVEEFFNQSGQGIGLGQIREYGSGT